MLLKKQSTKCIYYKYFKVVYWFITNQHFNGSKVNEVVTVGAYASTLFSSYNRNK